LFWGGLIIAGVCLVYVPAGLVVAGVAAAAAGLFAVNVDSGEPS
jgi:hypothetical protein